MILLVVVACLISLYDKIVEFGIYLYSGQIIDISGIIE